MNRDKLLTLIKKGLTDNTITRDDLHQLLKGDTAPSNDTSKDQKKPDASIAMFLVGGIIIYAALFAFNDQVFGRITVMPSAVLFIIAASVAWGIVLTNKTSADEQDPYMDGGVKMISLFGSLSLITGASVLFISILETISLTESSSFLLMAAISLLIGALHLWFGKSSARLYSINIGTLLITGSFLAVIAAVFYDVDSINFWVTVFILLSGILAALSRKISQLLDTPSTSASMDSLATLIALGVMYIASFDDAVGFFWLLLSFISIFSLYYRSIQLQGKQFLGLASLFLSLIIITISFRYFSGAGITFSLLISAIGVIGTAVVANNINKKFTTS